MSENRTIYVESEFAPLRKVVLTQSEFVFPCEEDDADDYAFLPEEILDLYEGIDIAGKDYREVFPERQYRWEQERENLKKVLEKYGVQVLRPRLLTDYEKEVNRQRGSSNFFVRDPFFTIGSSVIEGSLRLFHRRNEILPIRNVLIEETYGSDAYYVAVPQADISGGIYSDAGPFLEGGDVLVLGKTIFVGNSGLASNHNGYLWLKSYLSHWDYQVIEVPLRKDVLHLDCALSLVREGLMIVCEEVLPNGIPEPLKDWDRINVSARDVAYLAVNGLPVNEQVYITDTKFEGIAAELERRNIHVELVDFEISRSLGGSFRCSTQPLERRYPTYGI